MVIDTNEIIYAKVKKEKKCQFQKQLVVDRMRCQAFRSFSTAAGAAAATAAVEVAPLRAAREGVSGAGTAGASPRKTA
jgi:hypothetical protein